LEKFSDNSDAMLECGRFALRQGHPEEAEPFLSRAVQLAPHDHEAHYQLAVCLGQLNRPSEARKHRDQLKQLEEDMILLEKTFMALVEKPGDLQLRREAGKICLRHGQVSEGLRWLTGILDLAPDDKPTHQILGDYFASQGETQRAKYHHDKAR
jgi:Flp pilus assembly protein TadD